MKTAQKTHKERAKVIKTESKEIKKKIKEVQTDEDIEAILLAMDASNNSKL